MTDLTIDEIMALGETHTKAMADKPKGKKKKKIIGAKPGAPTGLAASSITGKQNKTKSVYDEFMTGKPKLKR